MKPYYEDDYVTLYNDDCMNILKEMKDESIDCVVTDCPYHIIAGGVKVMEEDSNEPKGCLGRRNHHHRKIVSDGTGCSNKWLKNGIEVLIVALPSPSKFT